MPGICQRCRVRLHAWLRNRAFTHLHPCEYPVRNERPHEGECEDGAKPVQPAYVALENSHGPGGFVSERAAGMELT